MTLDGCCAIIQMLGCIVRTDVGASIARPPKIGTIFVFPEGSFFPEITYDQVDKIRGMDVAIVTTANTDEEARELLRALGMPFKK